jgi:histidinol dehydrogenase
LIKTLIITDVKSDAAKLRNSITSSTIPDELVIRTKSIMDDISKYGDSAVKRYTEQFDGVKLNLLKVTDEEIRQAYTKVSRNQIRSIMMIKERLTKIERALWSNIQKDIMISSDGVRIERTVQPISSVGCYIPGGNTQHYPSTIVMCAIPAKIARVKRVVATSPPLKDGTIDPLTLVAADICGIDEFYKVGGAQGIIAMALGTSSIRRVSKIVGPGGMFVTIAKILASSRVSIDMVAGPTELLVYADSSADPRLITLDLISQAEHSYDTFCGLVTTSKKLATEVKNELRSILLNNDDNIITRSDIVKKSMEQNGFIAVCKNESTAIDFVNEIAPEHLEIMTKNARTVSKKIISAGLVLIGKYTPSSASDYCLGSNHVLPTLGFGKSRASLSVLDFVRITNTVEASKPGLKKIQLALKEITLAEGLMNHYEAVKERIDDDDDK